ncbi:MAG: hypothetical protein U1F68_01705 [Gammaproteobacteria bacterium]
MTEDRGYYGLIFIDPPTFSNSKSLPDDFDAQRDHVALIQLAMHRLSRVGRILLYPLSAPTLVARRSTISIWKTLLVTPLLAISNGTRVFINAG